MQATASAETARLWLATVPRDRERWEAARRAAVPPPGVQLLAPGLAVLADAAAPSAAPALHARLAETCAAVEHWLASTLGFGGAAAGFPRVLVHFHPAHALTPRAYLYPDGGANRVTLGDGEVKPEQLIHELVHALSGVRHTWSSELLAYHAGFTGLDGGLPTRHRQALASHDIALEDVLHHGLPWARCLAGQAGQPPLGMTYEPGNPYCGFLLAHLFHCLRERPGGAPVLGAYLREIDDAAAADHRADGTPADEGRFETTFGVDRRGFVAAALAALAAPRTSRPGRPHELDELGDTLRAVQRCWWSDIFDLVYPRTAWARHHPHHPDAGAALLYLDYRIYRTQRAWGGGNATALRQLIRASARLLRTAPGSALAVALRYFLLTEHALDQYQGRMALLPQLDADLSSALRATLATLDEFALPDPGHGRDHLVASLARGHFHLFYPASLGAAPARGVRLLEDVLERDPTCEEAYLHLATYSARLGDRAAVATWIARYRAAVADPTGPSLLAHLTTGASPRTTDTAPTTDRREP